MASLGAPYIYDISSLRVKAVLVSRQQYWLFVWTYCFCSLAIQARYCTCKRNTRAPSLNRCFCAKVRSITCSECVSVALVIQHTIRMRRIISSSVACPALPYFYTLSHIRHDSQKIKLLSIKVWIWCDFDRASSLICGNKMPTRRNRGFLLQILLLAQHVSDTTMPIIRSSRVLYRWLLPVVFRAVVFKLLAWCGAPNTTGSNHCIIFLSFR